MLCVCVCVHVVQGMCVGVIKRPLDCSIPSLGGVEDFSEFFYYPDHQVRHRAQRSLVLTFFVILMVFYAAFKVMSSMYEFRESVIIFIIAFAFGFLSATRR